MESLASYAKNKSSSDGDGGRVRKRFAILPLRIRKHFWPYLFLTPALSLFLIFFVLPFLFSFGLSFAKWNLTNSMEFVGLSNYASILADPVFRISFRNTVFYVLGTVPVSMLIAMVLAFLIESLGRTKQIYRFLLFIPYILSTAITSLIWVYFMNPSQGLLNEALRLFGIEGPNWLKDPQWALFSLMLVGVWYAVSYNIVLYVAGLQGINRQLYEAAAVDGAGGFKQVLYVTVPQLLPIHIFVLTVSIIHSFQVFTKVQIMTQGGPNNATNVLVYQLWQEGFRFFDIGRASALSMILFMAVMLLVIAQIVLMERKSRT